MEVAQSCSTGRDSDLILLRVPQHAWEWGANSAPSSGVVHMALSAATSSCLLLDNGLVREAVQASAVQAQGRLEHLALPQTGERWLFVISYPTQPHRALPLPLYTCTDLRLVRTVMII